MLKRFCLSLILILAFPLCTAYCESADIYKQAQNLMASGDYAVAAEKFESIGSYEDASLLAMYCKACAFAESGNYEIAISALESLGDYKDCNMRIIYYNARAYEDAAGTENWDLMEEAKAIYNTIPLFLDTFNRISALDSRIETAKSTLYNAAMKSGESGDYETACSAFERLGSYSDSEKRYVYYRIRQDEARLNGCTFPDAFIVVADSYTNMLGDYLDCLDRVKVLTEQADKIVADQYADIAVLIEQGQYAEAEVILAQFGMYGNEQVTAHYYTIAEKYLAEGKWNESSAAFAKAGTYKDAAQRIYEPYYKQGETLMLECKWDDAFAAYRRSFDFGDAAKRIRYCELRKMEDIVLMSTDQSEMIAVSILFTDMGDYLDCTDHAKIMQDKADAVVQSKYAEIDKLIETRQYGAAEDKLAMFGTYGNEKVKEKYYKIAEKYVETNQWRKASITFKKASQYKDALSRAYEIEYRHLHKNKIAAGSQHTIGLKSDGSVVAVGNYLHGKLEVTDWSDIVAVEGNSSETIGLKADGTVVSEGLYAFRIKEADLSNIVAITRTSFLKTDGTVVPLLQNGDIRTVSDWTDIVAISGSEGEGHLVGLKADGRVVAAGYNGYGELDVGNWRNIVAVAAGGGYTVGLKADGTVVAVGGNFVEQCNVSGWTDIIAIAAGEAHTVGLKSDGTVIAVGLNEHGQCNVSGWTDIVAIAAGDYHTVGMKSDGTVVAVGEDNGDGRLDISGWDLCQESMIQPFDNQDEIVTDSTAAADGSTMLTSIRGSESQKNAYSFGASDSAAEKLNVLRFSATASSVYYPKYNKEYTCDANMAVDGNLKTAWNEGANGSGIGEWIRVTPTNGKSYSYNGFRIANGFQYHDYPKGDRWSKNNRVKYLSVYDDSTHVIGRYLIDDNYSGYQTIYFDSPVTSKYLHFTIDGVWEGSNFSEACISEIVPLISESQPASPTATPYVPPTATPNLYEPYDIGIPQLNGRVYKHNELSLPVLWVQYQLKATGVYYQGEYWDETGNLGGQIMKEVARFMKDRGYPGHSGQVDQQVINEIADALGSRRVPVYVGGFYEAMDSVMTGGSTGTFHRIQKETQNNRTVATIGGRWAQTCLSALGYYNKEIDGKFGDGSIKALQKFQKDHHYQLTESVSLGVARIMLEEYYHRGFSLDKLP